MRKRRISGIVFGSQIVRILFLLFAFFPSSVAAAEELEANAAAALIQSIEDYRYADYERAIETLKGLHAAHPGNLEVVRYLALASEESGNSQDARLYFAEWVRLAPSDREAVLGQARVFDAMGQTAQAIEVLSGWLAGNEADVDARIRYAALLVKSQRNSEAEAEWLGLAARSDIETTQRSVIHFYLAYLAYQRSDAETLKQQAELSIQADTQGDYAASARQLLTLPLPESHLGFAATAMAGGFYTSNVELLPDRVKRNDKKPRSDIAANGRLSLAYSWQQASLGINFYGNKFRQRTEYDSVMADAYLQWVVDSWRLVPSAGTMMLGGYRLFQAGAFNLGYEFGSWTARYGIVSTQYSKSFGVQRVDLTGLSSLGNEIEMQYRFALAGANGSVAADFHNEAARLKVNSYRQMGGTARIESAIGSMALGLRLRGYYRQYPQRDPRFAPYRHDYFGLTGGYLRIPLDGAGKYGLLLNALYQQNRSSYTKKSTNAGMAKDFSEWQLGANVQGSW